MKDLTLKIQTEVMGKQTGLKAITDGVVKKGNVKSVKKKTKKETKKETKSVKDKAGSVMKRPAARTSTCSSTRSKSDDSLTYRPVKDSSPRYYGEVTIYTDIIQNLWRIKPGRARRDHKKIVFGDKPREQWKKVVKWVKEL